MFYSSASPSVIQRCQLAHLTHKIIPKMTYNVSSGTLNPTLPYQSRLVGGLTFSSYPFIRLFIGPFFC